MEDSPLPLYSRKTTFRVRFTDIAANVGITVGGLGVILAVMGLIVFIFLQVYPLFEPGKLAEMREPIKQDTDKALVIHCDEYRRVGVRINESGRVAIFSLPTGETIQEFKPKLLGDATGLKVTIQHGGKGGELRVKYSTLDQLDELCRRLKA